MGTKMSEPPYKKMKRIEDLHEDIVDHIISNFLPIKSFLQSRNVSRTFRNTEIRCRNLDFSEIYSKRRSQSEVVHIVEGVFNQHKGSTINRFILALNHIGVEDKILSWINACLGKNIQELELDFSKSRKVIEISINFSAIETLTMLKLRWCEFQIPGNSPKGLKLLKTLSLMRAEVTKDMIDAIFKNCIYLEALELIKCRMNEVLSINAQNHKKFKSLVVYSMPKVLQIVLDAPTLECYKYDGHVRMVDFSKVNALKEAKLQYYNRYNWQKSYKMVIDNMSAYVGVHALATTNVFLEALTYDYERKGRMENPTFQFMNLKEIVISFKAPSVCNLFDIAEFLIQCPKLEKVFIDIEDFTFEPTPYWERHQKDCIRDNKKYILESIKEVEINGYKNHSHELDIVEFFVLYARSLDHLILKTPRNPDAKQFQPDERKISYIKGISPKKDLIMVL